MRRAPGAGLLLAMCGALLLAALSRSEQGPVATGPQTEKRFPPLKLPAGFKATLFACDPLIEYPSVIAIGPRPRTLFVAVDYMTGLGTDIIRRDEVRLIEDTDGDGYADRATVFASGFNSIQGLAYHRGTVYVMHAPYLTALRDTRGTGKADERRDLFTGLGLPPEKDQIRLHNANGVVVGHDGWLYLALGDRGCNVTRPEGDRLVFDGGGILRCRPDGRDLHVFSTGLRNIYDVALDEDLNAFVRDNENDGGAYKIRVCHSFFGADHGYPYLYYERPDEALPPLADLGLGSSAGAVCYLERQFPAEYRGNLFLCEWGRAVTRYRLERRGGSFASHWEIDFASGAGNDPYGFKPTDLVVGHDGSLFISDWADGQRPKRGRGRIYQVRHVAKEAPPAANKGALALLDSDSYYERWKTQEALEGRGKEGLTALVEALQKKQLGVRGRLHAVWALAKIEGAAATEKLFDLAKNDPEPRVQAQAVRALADLLDPVLVRHRLNSGRGEAAVAERLAALAVGREARVQLEVVIALGRLGWADAPAWLRRHLKAPDPALAHAAQWALRRADNWPAVLKLLDEPSTEPFRAIARRAVANQYSPQLVDGLAERLRREADPARRREYADALTRVYKKPASWTYWGFRPPPRPANTSPWERTEVIEQALDRALADPDRAVRLDLLTRMVREKVPARVPTLARWLQEERDPKSVAAILNAFRERPASESRPHVERVLQDRQHTKANRLLAVSFFVKGLDTQSEGRLLPVAESVEDGPVLAELFRAMAARKGPQAAAPLLLRKLASAVPEVRATALGALAGLKVTEVQGAVQKSLDDPDARVRSAAAQAAGKLALRATADQLLKRSRDSDAEVRRSSLEALRRLGEPRALPVALAALADRETSLKALECVGELGGPEHVRAVTELARRDPSTEILSAVGKVLTGWAGRKGLPAGKRQEIERSLASIHGSSGNVLGWYTQGPLKGDIAADLVGKVASGNVLPTGETPAPGWRLLLAAGIDARAHFGQGPDPASAWLGYSEVTVPEGVRVEFLTAGSGRATVWLNGKVVYQRDRPGVSGPYPDRFDAALAKGDNQILVRLTGVKGAAELQLRFRRKGATPEHERLTLAALTRAGNPERGRQVFLNAEKSLCVKCHRVGEQGEPVGPELTGLGSRFAKAYIIESILEPGRTIAPSFETTGVQLKNGQILSGVKVAETADSLTLVDNQTQKHVLARADIDRVQRQSVSAMPDGLERRLTEDEFVDLISFLTNLKEPRGR
ncbi:MAG: HEAT repeat domain-containing protein [Gemmataceae bacterium]|nr:HEAT repeat domain-containing protein [Gemmataceae bacterium]